ncbi:MAG TPA: hypothetical protein ENK18_21925 [Deltaproteobacteria bacterium]|nr:hypothetical protein [Deltaproteobacteria bacterium]
MVPTFLQLPPDLGGLRYGPFRTDVVFGSDGQRCQMVLDPGHGIYPVHATLIPQGTDTYTLQPAGPSCKVFLIPPGQTHVWPVTSPVQAQAGATVILGTPSGPRFQIQRGEQAYRSAFQGQGDAALLGGLDRALHRIGVSGSGVGAELSRRIQASLLSGAGPVRDLYRLWTRVKTGQLANPVVWVGALFALLGALSTGAVGCSGLVWVVLDALGIGR